MQGHRPARDITRRISGFAMRTLVLLGLEALLLVGLTAILPGVETLTLGAAALIALVLALINSVLWPALTRVALPLTILSFGLGSLALSAGGVALAFYVVEGDLPPFGTDIAIAFALALAST